MSNFQGRILPLVDKKLHQRLPIRATPFIRSNPTAERTDGNVCVVSSQDNVENLKIQFRSTARIKDTMKSIKQTIVKVVNYNKRKWIETLKPKGMESRDKRLHHKLPSATPSE